MPNVNDGLQQPAADEAVNSEAGFAAALAGRGVEPDEADKAATDTSIASGLETVEPGKDRGPDGRFLPKQTPDTPEPKQDTSTDVAQVTSDDPAVASLLAKYDNDPVKALKAAAEAQSLLGRQGQQIGTLSEQLAKQQGQIEALMATATRPAMPALSDEQVEETASNLVATTGGYAQAATRAVNDALESGDFRVYDSLLEQWVIESPIAAQRFDLDFQLWNRDQKAPAATTQQSDQWVEEQKAQAAINATMKRVQEAVGDEAFAAIVTTGADGESAMTKALATIPKALTDLIASNDPEEQYAATQLVADRARLLIGAAPAAPQDSEPGLPVSVQRKLQGAGVATAGLRPVAPPAGSPQSREDVLKQFKQDILAAETTSVAAGLTYGK